ncbi:uroporphyrinogen decarboxylase [Plakobranchus ocellatus]|uniref:Uroporphyrinogen decarboxylase n=1 Tax=Plakobranchus ocellatus TaxID=259542 RepID=A0AAV3YH72_9GAST|nr:uroporphyrinogen decarboxylase [Plakobranchus ocellatus]
MGLKVANQPGQGPVFADPITCPEDLKRISADFDIVSQLGWVYEAITLARRKLEGEVPLIGFTGSSRLLHSSSGELPLAVGSQLSCPHGVLSPSHKVISQGTSSPSCWTPSGQFTANEKHLRVTVFLPHTDDRQ